MKSPTRQSLVFLTILFLANANAKFAPHQGCGLLSESWTVPVESLSDEINFDQVDQYLSHIENVSRPPSRSYHEEQYLPGGHCRHSDILCTSHQTRGKSAMGPYPLSPLPSVHQTIQATHGNLRMGEKTSLTEEHMEADKYLRTSITTSPSQQSSADGLDQFTKSSAPLGANDIMSFEEIERFLSGPSSPKSRKQERVEDGPRPELLSDGCRTPVGFAASYKCQRLDESFPMRKKMKLNSIAKVLLPHEVMSAIVNDRVIRQNLSEQFDLSSSQTCRQEPHLPIAHIHPDIPSASRQALGKSATEPYVVSPSIPIHQEIQTTGENLRMEEKTFVPEDDSITEKSLRAISVISPSGSSNPNGLDQFANSSTSHPVDDMMTFEEIETFASGLFAGGPASPNPGEHDDPKVADDPHPEFLPDGYETHSVYPTSQKRPRLDESFS
ncbi:hypothetical protein PCASD_10019 [Puccinia coronata f. sp. avenae]|nr:hypothetical protein PCASD_10019 [Puccinia coronata f. sp. avenae]